MGSNLDPLLNKLVESLLPDEASLRVNIERRQKEPLLAGITKPELLWQGDPEVVKKLVESILKKKTQKFTAAEVDFIPCGAFRCCQSCLHYKNTSKEPDGLCLFRQSESDDHIAADPIQKFRVRPDSYCDAFRIRKMSWKSPKEMPDIPDIQNIRYGFANTQSCRNYQNVIDGRPWSDKEKDQKATGYLNSAITRTCAACRFFSFPNLCRIVETPVTVLSFCHVYTPVISVVTRPIIDPHEFGNTDRVAPAGEYAWKEEESERKLTGTGD